MLQTLAKDALAGAFDDSEVGILVEALDQAWKAVQKRESKSATTRLRENYSPCA
jgi:hypothetical protein